MHVTFYKNNSISINAYFQSKNATWMNHIITQLHSAAVKKNGSLDYLKTRLETVGDCHKLIIIYMALSSAELSEFRRLIKTCAF